MAFELIPFPISTIFVLVFGVAVIAVLWKLRRRGKVYLLLSNISLIVGVIVLMLIVYSILTGPPQNPSGTVLVPQPSEMYP